MAVDTQPELRPITKITRPLVKFLHIEAASGVVLMVAAAIAIAIANSPLLEHYNNFWNTEFRIGAGDFVLSYPLWYWVNDGLMAIFFFLVGLEIKRELVSGELRDARRVVSPAVAAAGGAAVPAVIFLLILGGQPGQEGWAIPMATDIAFVVGVMALLGNRVPHGLKVFLLTVAIVDDIIAVLVIALFYSSKLSIIWLAGAVALIGVVLLMNRLGVRSAFGYLVVGAAVWLCTLKSGIHPTVSGVVLGLLTPATPFMPKEKLKAGLERAAGEIEDTEETHKLKKTTREVEFAAREAVSPLERFEELVHPWAAFVIMPVFALANAGVPFSASSLSSTMAITVALALMIGKPVGIFASLFLVVKAKLGVAPGGANWWAVVGAGSLAGIGFTMSLFIASLSLEGSLLVEAKSGILVGSAINGVLGFILLVLALKKREENEAEVSGSKA